MEIGFIQLGKHLHLPDRGICGNDHGLICERNSDRCLAEVLRWLEARAA